MYDHMLFSQSSHLVDPGMDSGVPVMVMTGPGQIKTEIEDEIFSKNFSKSVEVHVLWVIFPGVDLTGSVVVFGHSGVVYARITLYSSDKFSSFKYMYHQSVSAVLTLPLAQHIVHEP